MTKPFWQMSAAELREATREFDKPTRSASIGRALTQSERIAFETSRRGGLRVVDIDPKLLKRASIEAGRLGITLGQYIEQSLRGMIAFKGGQTA